MRHLPHTRSADCNPHLRTSIARSHRKARIIRDDVMPASGENYRRRRFSTTQQNIGSIGNTGHEIHIERSGSDMDARAGAPAGASVPLARQIIRGRGAW
jgi:hypothetical protein